MRQDAGQQPAARLKMVGPEDRPPLRRHRLLKTITALTTVPPARVVPFTMAAAAARLGHGARAYQGDVAPDRPDLPEGRRRIDTLAQAPPSASVHMPRARHPRPAPTPRYLLTYARIFGKIMMQR
jgi:hypothetical protein